MIRQNERNAERAGFINMRMMEGRHGGILAQDHLNPNWQGITFPGEHVKKGESFSEAVIRKVREETGLTISHPQRNLFLRGERRLGV